MVVDNRTHVRGSQDDQSLLVFTINFDWRDIFRTNRKELNEKLQRDQLRPDINRFFFFSWAHVGYVHLAGQYRSVHTRTFGLHVVRPLLNLYALVVVPITAWRYRVRPDVWLAYDFGMVPALWLCKMMFGGTLLMVVNNQPHLYSRVRRFGWLKAWYSYATERMNVGLVEHFFTLNETMRAYLANLGVPRESTSLYTVNTIERDRAFITTARTGVIRERFRLTPEKKILLAVARLEAEKNHTLLIDLFSTLPPEYVLMCLGEGSYRAELEKQTERLALRDRVFLPGNIERDDIWNYYKDANAFVLLSKVEALGIVFWEAMYVRVPVLGSAVPGIMESLGADRDRGRLWAELDGAQGFRERVMFCTTQSPERDAMIARAKTFVDEKLGNRATLNDYMRSRGIHS